MSFIVLRHLCEMPLRGVGMPIANVKMYSNSSTKILKIIECIPTCRYFFPTMYFFLVWSRGAV